MAALTSSDRAERQFRFADHQMVMKSRVGSHWYASPELLTYSDTYNEKIDIWGLGLIVYIMITGEHPFE